jgi:hypothetical protein
MLRLLFAAPVVVSGDPETGLVQVAFGLLNPGLADVAVLTKEFPSGPGFTAAVAEYIPAARAELMGAIEGLFPGEYSLDALYPVPERVSMSGARVALRRAGLLDTVEAAIDAIPDVNDRADARIVWEYATTIDRYHPLIQMLAGPIGLTEAAIDDLFRVADGV